ncbi:L-lactate permease [Hyphomicrobium sp.]|jgi:lactate permease|uniref:L-lactate permease n=1 Tax=Hyphomicrobium sp. TaxID=82 RepID=UPI0035632CB5
MWSQVYDPLGSMLLSAAVALIPVVVLLASIGLFEVRAHLAALLGLSAALLVAVLAYGMPAPMAGMAAAYGAAFGFLPIGWIILNVIFLYRLASEKGEFEILQSSIARISDDRRLQLLFVAFSFGAFFEGAAGFGTPVAVTSALLIGLGFPPLAASGLSLIANTAPVAFGALGTPVVALSAVTGLDLYKLSAMVGMQLAPFAIIVPFWLIWAFVGFRKMIEVWPAILVAGVSFAIPQFLISNYHGPWLVNVVAALVSMASLALFLKVWSPAIPMTEIPNAAERTDPPPAVSDLHSFADLRRAWMPWIILAVCVFLWGTPQVRAGLDGLWMGKIPVSGLHELVQKMPPVVPSPRAEAAIFNVNILSATGTGILIAAIISGILLGYGVLDLVRNYLKTIYVVRYSLLTISCMMAIGFVTRYSGSDATLGLTLAHSGWAYPFFGTMIGWLGVALTGSDTSSNVLFGGLQKITAEQLGLSPILMAAANSAGGVMGKMIDAQSIVVASTATKWYGHEGSILRFVFFHSLALAALVGLLVMGQAYLWPFNLMVR